MKIILLCPPKFYDIEYEINPWMDVKNKVNKDKVWQEYKEIKNTYLSLGAEVLEITPQEGLPDMVYAANFGFPIGKTFIKSNFKFAQRRKEADFAKEYFEDLGFSIVTLPENIYFEGQGDLLYADGKYFMGFGKRSSYDAKKYLEEFLKSEVFDLKLSDPYFYHLDMSLAFLDSQTAVINKNSFDKEGIEKIYKNFENIIEVSDSDSRLFACNLVVINKNIVIGRGISNELKNSFEKYGFKTYEVPMIEYGKGGGSVKCLTLEFF